MASIHHDSDAELSRLEGEALAVVGYGNQGRSQALNLRDSGLWADRSRLLSRPLAARRRWTSTGGAAR